MNTIGNLRLRPVHYYILLSASMEQIIGAALSTLVGIMLPMIQLLTQPELSTLVQGLIGASGLIGIGLGSAVIGAVIDRQGYLLWFRLCPVVIMAGAAMVFLWSSPWMLAAGFFVSGIGVGGGYSLDSAYISELMPARWRSFMVGVAKGLCALGFIGAAVICYFVLRSDPRPAIWPKLAAIIGVMGFITLLLRIYWVESPDWLLQQGRTADAQKAAARMFGPGVTVNPLPAKEKTLPFSNLFKGENLKRVIFSGIPWACEGVGVYGIGVFLPVLVMALGLQSAGEHGMPKIISSVEITAFVNFFILPGFALGLWLARRRNHVKLLAWGFILCAIGLAILLAAYLLKWPVWVSLAGFMLFELCLNGGPHLITFIIPAQIFPVANRGKGTGIASLLGKLGAIAGVFFMPMLLDAGGMTLVLIVTGATMLLGAAISLIYGKMLKLV
ncbi:MAG: sugar porter family MFS transporter [Muribaculaceae bacterium]|nr:sugar porter family MFS transporter [Muribaculaceae bacterium]